MEGEQLFDIEAVIADLEAKKIVIDNTITALRALYRADADGTTSAMLASATVAGVGVALTRKPTECPNISSETFFGMGNVREAGKKYLGIVKRKQTTKQIVDALEQGGFPHRSKNFFNTVYTTLQREAARENGEIVRIGSEWAMAAWFPGHARRSKEADRKEKPAKKAKAVKKPKTEKAEPRVVTMPTRTPVKAPKSATSVEPKESVG